MVEPTNKQIKMVDCICKTLHISPPNEYSKASYWEFTNKYIDQYKRTAIIQKYTDAYWKNFENKCGLPYDEWEAQDMINY